MATALESYYVDSNLYHTWSTDHAVTMMGNTQTGEALFPSFVTRFESRSAQFGAMTLPSPISYITSYSLDIFSEQEQTFGYFTWVARDRNGRNLSMWIVVSLGPNRVFDIPWREVRDSQAMGTPLEELLRPYTYDPPMERAARATSSGCATDASGDQAD